MPSSVAAIQRITGWRTQLWTLLTMSGGALEPAPIEGLSRKSKLDEQIVDLS
jgi:hypothetical protein